MLWREDTRGGSATQGSRKNSSKYGFGIGHYYRCKKVSKGEYLKFLEIIDKYTKLGDSAWSVTNNCAGFAYEAANAVDLLDGTLSGDIMGIPTPRSISDTIGSANSGSPWTPDTKSEINPFGKTGQDWGGGLDKPSGGHINPKDSDTGASVPIQWS